MSKFKPKQNIKKKKIEETTKICKNVVEWTREKLTIWSDIHIYIYLRKMHVEQTRQE